jgi:hypothetical protein
MNRTEALKVLHLDEGSDSHAVETSYWTLVRHAQTRSPDETTAAREVEELNRAYAALTPAPTRMETVRKSSPSAGAGRAASAGTVARPGRSDDNIIDSTLTWLGEEAVRVRQRWAGRNAEVALICGAVAALAVAALMANASPLIVLACVVVVFVGVWSPWRDEPPHEDQDPPDGDR